MRVCAQEITEVSVKGQCPVCGQPVAVSTEICAGCGLRFTMDMTDPGKMHLTNAAPSAQRRPSEPATGRSWFARYHWTEALIGLVLLVIAGMVVTSLAQSPNTQRGVSGPVPTATALLPTATPLPQPGYAYYTDHASGFQIQYPHSWQSIPQNPGVEIDDSAQNPAYVMQVLLPAETQDATTDWVAYELNNLRQTSGTTAFKRLDGTLQLQAGGLTWTGAAATLQQGTTTINVQVYSTVHLDRTYVINLLAANAPIETARARYFNTMLNTLAFAA